MKGVLGVVFFSFLMLVALGSQSTYAEGACSVLFQTVEGGVTSYDVDAAYVSSDYGSFVGNYPEDPAPTTNGQAEIQIFETQDNQKTKLFYSYAQGKLLDIRGTASGCTSSLFFSISTVLIFSDVYHDRYLDGGVCRIEIESSLPTVTPGGSFLVEYTISLLPEFIEGVPAYIPEELRRDYYDMKAKTLFVIEDSSGAIVFSEEQIPLFEPLERKERSYSIPSNLPPGEYEAYLLTDPSIDSKCEGLSEEVIEDLGSFSIQEAGSAPEGVEEGPDLIISSDAQNVNLATLLPSTQGNFEVLIEAGVTIGSENVNLPALTTGSLAQGSSVTLVNKGTIVGKGGKGGESIHKENGGKGQNGGPALMMTVPLLLDNTQGRILGGGGGGGAGGAGEYCQADTIFGCALSRSSSGGGGGAGAGFTFSEGGSASQLSFKKGQDGQDATSLITPGSGGEAVPQAGNGGSGGAPGENGNNGQVGRDTGQNVFKLPGSGGSAGAAIIKQGNSLTFEGGEGEIKGEITSVVTSESGSCIYGNREIPAGEIGEFFRFRYSKPQRTCQDLKIFVQCSNSELIFINNNSNAINPPSQIHILCTDVSTDLSSGTTQQSVNGSVSIETKDNRTKHKVRVKPDENQTVFIDGNGTEVNVNLPLESEEKKIKIFKNGVLEREDPIDPQVIALKAHYIKNLQDEEELEEFVEASTDLMDNFDIAKNLTYDNISNTTQVRIQLENIPEADRFNITIYQVIAKEVAASVDDITFISDGGGQRLILDQDPVIGWYFNESEGDESIEYETEGETEGGTIIITYEPILFNEGELVINYREGGCNPGEIALFEVDDFEYTQVYDVGSGSLYTVCISHLEEDLIKGTLGALDRHLFTYADAGNVSFDDSLYSTLLDLSVDNTSELYWDMQYQEENPNGNYSCLGSLEDVSNSLFGDCGFTTNRIWLHLGVDHIPPTTNMTHSVLAHTMKYTLTAADNVGGAGVDSTYYCVDDDNVCSPTTEYTGEITVTCPFDFGCTKFLRFYSTDLEGNSEIIQSEQLRLIDKGSACEATCMATPHPNRFLKECRNLNGCEYKDKGGDEGLAVAEACDFLTWGSYAPYDDENEVLCPNGPLREKRFTDLELAVEDTICDNLLSVPYVGVVDGAAVVMRVLTCQDE